MRELSGTPQARCAEGAKAPQSRAARSERSEDFRLWAILRNMPKSSEFSDGVIIRLVVFEESLSLFALGNTGPGYGRDLL